MPFHYQEKVKRARKRHFETPSYRARCPWAARSRPQTRSANLLPGRDFLDIPCDRGNILLRPFHEWLGGLVRYVACPTRSRMSRERHHSRRPRSDRSFPSVP